MTSQAAGYNTNLLIGQFSQPKNYNYDSTGVLQECMRHYEIFILSSSLLPRIHCGVKDGMSLSSRVGYSDWLARLLCFCLDESFYNIT